MIKFIVTVLCLLPALAGALGVIGLTIIYMSDDKR